MKVVGLGSGTSVDSIDVVICEISVNGESKLANENTYIIKEIAFEKVDWSKETRDLIFECFNTNIKNQSTTNVVKLISNVNFQIGREFADAVFKVCKKNNVSLDTIDLIGSHGQTIWHNIEGEDGKTVTDTFQIGDISVISNLTSITTVGDFRTADVSTGGQGAPFASIFDSLILSRESENLAIQNIGGIGNVTILPSKQNNNANALPLSFDTGPGNVLIDYCISKITNGKLKYDDKGNQSRQGNVLPSILNEMLKHPFFQIQPPKSTGRELFSFEYADKFINLARLDIDYKSDNDILTTFTEFTAKTITDSYLKFSPNSIPINKIIIAGGGSNNDYLLERIKFNYLKDSTIPNSQVKVIKHDEIGFSSESKESLLFALLAVLNINCININLKSLTGNKSNEIGIKLGKISFGKNILNLFSKININQ